MNAANGRDSRILIVEDDHSLAELLRDEVEDAGMLARLAHTAEAGLATAIAWLPDIMVSDLRLPGADGLALMGKVRAEIPANTPDFLIITAFGTVPKAVESLKAGAEDFLTKPLDLDHFKISLDRILEKRRMREQLGRIKRLVGEDSNFHGMFGRCHSMVGLFRLIRQVAKSGGPVLISGESGTGKELVARAVHEESDCATGPFLPVNCAGIPEALLESEFFGHQAGAFTGAGKSRQGIFAEAEGGTLFLDEISEMPPALQVKLLRMLQDGKIRPVGSNREQQIHVRIVAATNRNIEERVRSGDFREDLFYRLETFQVNVPPLRERGDDIDLLAGIFLTQCAAAADKRIDGFSPPAHELLRRYAFPGNVRELRNAIERAVAFCNARAIRPEHLPARIRDANGKSRTDAADFLPDGLPISGESLPTLEAVERRYIRHVMAQVQGNKRSAAAILGIGRRTLYRRLEEMDEG
jgi:two-component system, NtrC family, response regulator AtoC